VRRRFRDQDTTVTAAPDDDPRRAPVGELRPLPDSVPGGKDEHLGIRTGVGDHNGRPPVTRGGPFWPLVRGAMCLRKNSWFQACVLMEYNESKRERFTVHRDRDHLVARVSPQRRHASTAKAACCSLRSRLLFTVASADGEHMRPQLTLAG
jgi:hypothetical protein